MKRLPAFLIVVLAGVLVACSAGAGQPAGEPTAAPATAPTRVATSMPPVVATNTYIPLVEDGATPAATEAPSPTAAPTDVPAVPVDAIRVEPVLAGGLEQPTAITHAGDARLFVLERVGRIRIVAGGELLETPFLDISDRIGSRGNEQGLLGLAFHPNYARPGEPGEGTFYVNYTNGDGTSHISRFNVVAGDANRADPGSEVIYLTQPQPYPNHNGGSLAFGPDGYLYAGLGDGGGANDPLEAGQSLETWLGKILRLDVTQTDGAYTIPPDNPFAGQETALPEIWAHGLRNPWRFSFDRATGDLYIADVGQNQWEEVSFQPAGSRGGENYGWNIMEGTHCFRQDSCDRTGLMVPIFEYNHSQGCSVTGGNVYRGAAFPEMNGNYFVADYCSGTFWRLFPQADGWLADVVLESDLVVSTFGEGADGELYVTDYGSGGIYRILPD